MTDEKRPGPPSDAPNEAEPLGSEADIEELRRLVLAVLLKRGAPFHVAEELAQETLRTLWEKLGVRGLPRSVYEDGTVIPLKYVALRIGVYKWFKWLDKASNRLETGESPSDDLLVDPKYDPLRLELQQEVREAIATISPSCQELILWKHYEGMTADEIAEALSSRSRKEVTSENVYTRTYRCIKAFVLAYHEIRKKSRKQP